MQRFVLRDYMPLFKNYVNYITVSHVHILSDNMNVIAYVPKGLFNR